MSSFNHVALDGDIMRVANYLRKPFLDLISELGRRYNSPAWWSSRISERNTMISYLFLYCCYLRVAEERISDLSGTLCIVSESWAVLESLEKQAKKNGCKVTWVKKPAAGWRKILFWLRIVVRTLISARNIVCAKIIGSDSNPTRKDIPSIFIHTYVDEDCFGNNGLFHDRYFPGLSKWLEQRGYSVVTIPILFNIERSFRSAWGWFRQNRQKFVNPHKYYHIGDYIFAIRESWRQISTPGGQIILDGMDVTSLFDAERELWAFGCIDALLYFRLPKRLADKGFRIDLFIAEYENMINEKLLILGFRHYLPSTKLVGFQHGALYPYLLCNFVTREETDFAPLPHRVVCNGEFFREILVREGLPLECAVAGPSLRYAYLWNNPVQNKTPNEEPIDVFVPLPMMISDGVELLEKLIRAFGDMERLRFILKPHPMTPGKVLLKAAGIGELPPHFEFVRGQMKDWLPRAKVAIAISSSTIYEIMTFGIPVIVVGREAAIDLNPLGFYADLNKVFYSPEHIRAETLRLLALSKEELAKYRQRGEEVLRASFNPVNDETMQVFVDGLV